MVLVLKDPCVKPALECQSLTPQSHLLGYKQVNPKCPTAFGTAAQGTAVLNSLDPGLRLPAALRSGLVGAVTECRWRARLHKILDTPGKTGEY